MWFDPSIGLLLIREIKSCRISALQLQRKKSRKKKKKLKTKVRCNNANSEGNCVCVYVCVCLGAANQRFPTEGTKPAASSSCMTAPQWPPPPPTPPLHHNASSPRRSCSPPAVAVCPLKDSLLFLPGQTENSETLTSSEKTKTDVRHSTTLYMCSMWRSNLNNGEVTWPGPTVTSWACQRLQPNGMRHVTLAS